MKANELRIGNWVNYRIYDKLDNPQEYFDLSQVDAIDLQTLDDHYYQPIPITEEWLVKFGFGLDGEGWYWLRKKDHITPHGYSFNYYGNFLEIDELRISKIEFVHQLQNLYFALTGEELQINETT
jgi:hypothetical protein